MTALNKQELQIIRAFSSVDVPERIIRDSNIQELIHGMVAEQDVVQSDAGRLESLRQEKKDGNFIGNFLNDRDDKVQDAQIDLNKSIGRLTQKSSQLLIVNTAVSKVLNEQQRILLEQQNILKRQTDTLEEQNRKILEQQNLLERQQYDLNKANQGLLEAKGITQEQAQQLVGCVKLVNEVENRISAANHALRLGVKQDLHDSVEGYLARLDSRFDAQEQRYDVFERQINSRFSTLALQAQEKLERIISETAKHKSAFQEQMTSIIETLEQHSEAQRETAKVVEAKLETVENEYIQAIKVTDVQLVALQAEQLKVASSNRLAIALVATLTLLSLGWQVAQHFGLV